jgi:mxaL protein
MMRSRLQDLRFLSLLVAAVLLIAALAGPGMLRKRAAFDLLLVVDITGSMNARDSTLEGGAVSRLEAAKGRLRELIARLPCRSRMGLALFSERRSFLLFEPVELCDSFPAVDAALATLDWRMAWEGDSYVASGLYSAIAMAHELRADLIFLTDGHEAPPLPASGPPSFDRSSADVGGLIVGVGGTAAVPIPKFDDQGHEIGFWSMEEVPQENRSGMPPKDAASRAGFNPRNAPFGGAAAVGAEHLTSLREAHLRELARETGLHYVRLESARTLEAGIEQHAHSRASETRLDLSAFPAALALGSLILIYGGLPWLERRGFSD